MWRITLLSEKAKTNTRNQTYPPTEISKIYEIPTCERVLTKRKIAVSPEDKTVYISLQIFHFTLFSVFPNFTVGTGTQEEPGCLPTWLLLSQECQRQELAEGLSTHVHMTVWES